MECFRSGRDRPARKHHLTPHNSRSNGLASDLCSTRDDLEFRVISSRTLIGSEPKAQVPVLEDMACSQSPEKQLNLLNSLDFLNTQSNIPPFQLTPPIIHSQFSILY